MTRNDWLTIGLVVAMVVALATLAIVARIRERLDRRYLRDKLREANARVAVPANHTELVVLLHRYVYGDGGDAISYAEINNIAYDIEKMRRAP